MNITSPPWRYPGALKEEFEEVPQHFIMQSLTSPTRPGDIDNTEGVTAAMDGGDSNIDVENLGMTSERQAEIQGSLFKMLGHEDDVDQQS